MKKFTHLTLEDRIQIKILIRQGKKIALVAKQLNRNRSTIYRELKKWGITGDQLDKKIEEYDPNLAHWFKIDGKAVVNRYQFKLVNNKKLLSEVLDRLKDRWSPEQISFTLKNKYKNNKNMHVSHETIYQYIYFLAPKEQRNELIPYLRRAKKKRKSHYGSRKHKGKIKDRVSIDKRPKSVESRRIAGHWESDLIISKNRKQAFGTIVERKTRFLFIVKLNGRSAKEVRKKFIRTLKKLPRILVKSLTHDNGLEMAQHKKFTQQTGIPVYFCHPYSSWQRGTNENTNGLIRDFWPKGTDFDAISDYHIQKVQKLLNDRPRKILNGLSPKQAMIIELKKRKLNTKFVAV